eukprot:1141977-Rhodomonas_salina.1
MPVASSFAPCTVVRLCSSQSKTDTPPSRCRMNNSPLSAAGNAKSRAVAGIGVRVVRKVGRWISSKYTPVPSESASVYSTPTPRACRLYRRPYNLKPRQDGGCSTLFSQESVKHVEGGLPSKCDNVPDNISK